MMSLVLQFIKNIGSILLLHKVVALQVCDATGDAMKNYSWLYKKIIWNKTLHSISTPFLIAGVVCFYQLKEIRCQPFLQNPAGVQK